MECNLLFNFYRVHKYLYIHLQLRKLVPKSAGLYVMLGVGDEREGLLRRQIFNQHPVRPLKRVLFIRVKFLVTQLMHRNFKFFSFSYLEKEETIDRRDQCNSADCH